MPAVSPIPVIALVGFLGAGKTTLVKHILEHHNGHKIGVVVNDYGDINIDTQLVGEQSDNTLELTNGCICCSMDSMELDEAIAQFAYPGSPIDLIVIEASGLAEPADLASTLREAMTPATILDAIVGVIDAANWRAEPETVVMISQQIEHSDFIILNKADLVDESRLTNIKHAIRDASPRVRILTATNAAIDVQLLLEPRASTPSKPTKTHDHADHAHLHTRYASVSFATHEPLEPLAFQEFINHLPTEVYRAKGVVDLGIKGRSRKYILQVVGKRAQLTWSNWDNETPRTELVFIGQQLDTDALRTQVEHCIDQHLEAGKRLQPVVVPRHRP